MVIAQAINPEERTAEQIAQDEKDSADFRAEKVALENASIRAELDRNDLKIIRAIVEGDSVRINAHKSAQAALRARLK